MTFRDIADTWASIYANSPATRSVIVFAHLGALVVGGGAAITADVGTARALGRTNAALAAEISRLHGMHRLVIATIGVVVLSGLLLTLADFDSYVSSTAFWIKMGLFVLLMVNGALLTKTTATECVYDRSACLRLRLLTYASLTLWLATTLLGAVVPNAL